MCPCCRSSNEGNDRKRGCHEIEFLCCGESPSAKNNSPKKSFCCFSCRKISKNDAESRIEEKEKRCFVCFKSFNAEKKSRKKRGCESGCLSYNSLPRDDFSETRRCCFSCKKSSMEANSKGEGNGKECSSRFRFYKERKQRRRGCGIGCMCPKKSSSKEDLVERQRCCVSNKKLLKTVTESRKEEKDRHCFSCLKSSKGEGKERNDCGYSIGCSCCGELSSKDESSKSRRCCLPPKKTSKEESKSGKNKDNRCCSCFRSSKEDSSNKRKNGTSCCICCFDNNILIEDSSKNEERTICSCFDCCVGKSLKENSSRKEEKFYSQIRNDILSKKLNHQIISQRIRENEISTKRKENKVLCFCNFCCTKSLDKRKQISETKCIFDCFYCVKSESRQNSLFKKRKGSFCGQIKEQPKVGNHLTTIMHTLSLKSEYEDMVISQAEEALPVANENDAMQIFTYKEIATATKNFSEDCILGSDECGRVYKGELQEVNEIVAIKQLQRNGNQGENEFFGDVVKLSFLHHPNLVKLLGYCSEEDQISLVYEYIPFGSLQNHLFDMTPNKKPLDWFTRMKIAAGAAKALLHLHDVADPPIIYHNMKASNILLDENYNPKLSDFGLKKQTRVMGAYGCYAPEYAFTRQFTKTTDVYSFGVLLLELITGRKAVDITRPKNEQYVADWAAHLFKDKRKYPTMVDPFLNGNYPIKGLHQVLAIANMCLQYEASSRPLMSDIVTAIEYLIKPESDCSEPLEQSFISDQLISLDHEKLNFQSIPGSSRMQSAAMSLDDESFQSSASEIEICGALMEEDEDA